MGRCGSSCGVCCLSRSGGGVPSLLRLQSVCKSCAVPHWLGRQPSLRFWQSIAGCPTIAVFTLSCLGYSTPCNFTSGTLEQGGLIRYCVQSIMAHKHPPLVFFAIFNARLMLDCSSTSQSCCLAIVAGMLKPHQTIVATSVYGIQPLPPPYKLP
jgi:hypothetical protein